MLSFLATVWAFGLLYFFTLLLLGSFLQVLFPYDDIRSVRCRSTPFLFGFCVVQFLFLVSGILLFDAGFTETKTEDGLLSNHVQLRASGVAFACMITGVTQPSYRIRLEELAFRFRRRFLADSCPNPLFF